VPRRGLGDGPGTTARGPRLALSDRIPAGEPVPLRLPHAGRVPGLRGSAVRDAGRPPPRARAGAAAAGRPRGLGEGPAAALLEGDAAAGGTGPGADERSGAGGPRRADVRPRPGRAPPGPGPDR